MNILHLILGCKNNHYTPIENASKETWLKDAPNNIKTIFIYGGANGVYWNGNNSFYIDFPENLNICLYKTIISFNYFLESNFDYIFRSNNTGYFDYKLINKFIQNKPLKNFYCGCLGYKNQINFASGSGYFLSKDIVEQIVNNKETIFNYNFPGYYDDVSIGKFITQELKINIDPSALRLDVNPTDISDNLDMSHYHYRILHKGDLNSIHKIHKLKIKNDNYLR